MGKIGYACINLTLPGRFNTCRLGSVKIEGINMVKRLIWNNLQRTKGILEWNVQNNILMYRLTSELVPFGSHEILAGWDWWNEEELHPVITEIREYVEANGIRLTIHPGQFNVLNSPNPEVYAKTLISLEFEKKLLTLLGGTDMILHIGWGKHYRHIGKDMFVERYRDLPEDLKSLLRLENDDKVYTIEDVFDVCQRTDATPLYDLHHDICNPSIPREETVAGLKSLWKGKRPKIHLSTGREYRTDMPHADYLSQGTWEEYREMFNGYDVDAMLETKMKEKSVMVVKSWTREESTLWK